MARGRMLNRSISHSRQVAQLIEEVGPFGGLFLTWLIAHLDREGRVHGDPEVLKGMVAPRIAGITPALIVETLTSAVNAELVLWYEADGDSYVEFPGFDRNQPNMRKDREPESSLPAPTSEVSRHIAGMLPDDCRHVAGMLPDGCRTKRREEKGSEVEGKRREENDLSSCETQPDRVVFNGHIGCVFDHYRKHHPRSHPRLKAASKEWRAIKARLSEGWTVDDLLEAIDGMHKCPHNLGQNDRQQKYLGLELCMRSSDQVQRFIEVNRQQATPVMSARTQQTVSGIQQWLDGRSNAEDGRSEVCGPDGPDSEHLSGDL